MNISDKVKVINKGKNYSTYEDWIKKNAPQYIHLWVWNGNIVNTDKIYEVVAKAIHGGTLNDKMLYLISDGLQVFIIGEEGIEKIKMFHIYDKTDEKYYTPADRRFAFTKEEAIEEIIKCNDDHEYEFIEIGQRYPVKITKETIVEGM
jgi:hypothetical protein